MEELTDNLGPYQLNSIVCGECAGMMAALPDNCIDLWVTSPPYDNQRTYNGYIFDFERIAPQLYRVTKPGGVGVWVVADETKDGSESGTSFRQALGFMAAGFNLHDTMIYQKLNGAMGSDSTYLQEYEFMFIFSKGKPKSVNFLRDRRNVDTSNKSTPKKKSDTNGSTQERHKIQRAEWGRRKNIWAYAVGGKQEIASHPAPFPLALARDHILSWSNPGDIVFDPMVGSGTTAKQAHLLGRHYLGFDISEEYCQIARRRLANVEVQPFLMPPSVEANGKKPEQLGLLDT